MRTLFILLLTLCFIQSDCDEKQDETPRPIGVIKEVTLMPFGDNTSAYVTQVKTEYAIVIINWNQHPYIPIGSQGYLVNKKDAGGIYRTWFYYGGSANAYVTRTNQSIGKTENASPTPSPAVEAKPLPTPSPLKAKCTFTLTGRRRQTVNGNCEFNQ